MKIPCSCRACQFSCNVITTQSSKREARSDRTGRKEISQILFSLRWALRSLSDATIFLSPQCLSRFALSRRLRALWLAVVKWRCRRSVLAVSWCWCRCRCAAKSVRSLRRRERADISPRVSGSLTLLASNVNKRVSNRSNTINANLFFSNFIGNTQTRTHARSRVRLSHLRRRTAFVSSNATSLPLWAVWWVQSSEPTLRRRRKSFDRDTHFRRMKAVVCYLSWSEVSD